MKFHCYRFTPDIAVQDQFFEWCIIYHGDVRMDLEQTIPLFAAGTAGDKAV